MPYTTAEEMEERYGQRMLVQLTDRATPPAGTVDATVLARALADSDAMIDGYVGSRYQLPLSTVPPTLRDIALAITIYKLHRVEPAKKIGDDYRDALKQLGDIAAGRMKLEVEGAAPPPSPGGGVRSTAAEPRFTDENLEGFA